MDTRDVIQSWVDRYKGSAELLHQGKLDEYYRLTQKMAALGIGVTELAAMTPAQVSTLAREVGYTNYINASALRGYVEAVQHAVDVLNRAHTLVPSDGRLSLAVCGFLNSFRNECTAGTSGKLEMYLQNEHFQAMRTVGSSTVATVDSSSIDDFTSSPDSRNKKELGTEYMRLFGRAGGGDLEAFNSFLQGLQSRAHAVRIPQIQFVRTHRAQLIAEMEGNWEGPPEWM
ncbi:hypothetical protein WMF45_32205 [Sorangium sp. So ce448]|uniref:hypothetical protein n=1 Tax=Sorangium sp. So ce448 TaxID=3133314 RepID=UPI003F5E813F